MTIEFESVPCPRCGEIQQHVDTYPCGRPDFPISKIKCFCAKCNAELRIIREGVIIEENWPDDRGEPGWAGSDGID